MDREVPLGKDGTTYSCLMAMATSGVRRLQVAGSLLRSYVPASYVLYTAQAGAQIIRLLGGAVILRGVAGLAGPTMRRVGAEVLRAAFRYGDVFGSSSTGDSNDGEKA